MRKFFSKKLNFSIVSAVALMLVASTAMANPATFNASVNITDPIGITQPTGTAMDLGTLDPPSSGCAVFSSDPAVGVPFATGGCSGGVATAAHLILGQNGTVHLEGVTTNPYTATLANGPCSATLVGVSNFDVNWFDGGGAGTKIGTGNLAGGSADRDVVGTVDVIPGAAGSGTCAYDVSATYP